MRYAEVINNVVITINATGYQEDGQVEVPDNVFPGFILENGEWVAPPAPEPTREELYQPLIPWKFHAILAIAGLSGDLEAVLSSLDPIPQAVARSKLERVSEYYRDDPLTIQLGAAIGKTPEELDALWTQAHALT